MIPGANFNPSFANLAALRGLGGMPHPIRPVGGPPIYQQPPAMGMPGQSQMTAPMPMQSGPMPGQAPGYPGMPMQPQGNLSNLHALMQLLGQR